MTVIKNKLSGFQTFHIALVVFTLLSFSSTGNTGAPAVGDLQPNEIRVTCTDSEHPRTYRVRDNKVTARTLYPPYSDQRQLIKCVELGSAVVDIDNNAFAAMSALEQIRFNASRLRRVGDRAFADCSRLREVTLPKKVEEIGSYVFKGCHSLDVHNLTRWLNRMGPGAFAGCVCLRELHLDAGLVQIPVEAFKDCVSLVVLHLPKRLEKMGRGAFANCKGLAEVHWGGRTHTDSGRSV